MKRPATSASFLLILVSCIAAAQVMTIPSSGFGNIGSHSSGTASGAVGLGLISAELMTNDLFAITNAQHSPMESPSASVSKLDLKAPLRARHEYDKGYHLLMRKDYQNAVPHLANATSIYPNFVAAHNGLGSAYLNLGQNDQARQEFLQAVLLDDHLPNSHLNLGCAELALKHYSAAQESLQKASSIAPLDLKLLTALAYGQLMNQNYPAVIATSQRVHEHKHAGSAIVHYFAAGALDAEGKLAEEERELDTLVREEPQSAVAVQAHQILQELKLERAKPLDGKQASAQSVTFSFDRPAGPTSSEASQQAQQLLQNLRAKNQIAEAESEPEPKCADCETIRASTTGETKVASGTTPSSTSLVVNSAGIPTLRASVDEVALFFTATDHGKSVTGLTGADVGIRDDGKAPAAILGFRNESQLPLRLGLVIDTSDSIARRFSFEQHAAINFLQKVVSGEDDLAFVVGVANTILVVQDFTSDQKTIAHAVDQLAPSGGTALWDAVAFAADKLAARADVQPVAKVLVIISDGEDNSSSIPLKEAIRRAQHGEVVIYTVSTRDYEQEEAGALLGNHALRILAELTGGAAFTPGSVRRLNSSLTDLQQVLRGRYLISYKPALFQRDGSYRAIDITAQKNGRRLRVNARKGYYASLSVPAPDHN